MAQFNFGIRIDARDDTRSAIRSTRTAFQSLRNAISKPFRIAFRLPRQSLSLARDLRLTFGGLASQISRTLANAINEGSNLEVVEKSFQRLTRTSAKDAAQLARYVQQSANGTLTMADSMRIANRAMTGGIDVIKQLPVVLDFISKRSIATGKNASQAIDTVVTGLSRGSTLFLDDFGILVDGIESVKRRYDQIKGSGAFDSLGPASQKAEIIRQALKEMSQQQRLMGISGHEQAFQLQGMANSIRDAVSGLVRMVAGSKDVQRVIDSVATTVEGLSSYLKADANNSIFDFVLGKKGGQGQGLLGIVKGLFKDIGTALGEGIIEPIRAFLNQTPLAQFIKIQKPTPDAAGGAGARRDGTSAVEGSSAGRLFSNMRKAFDDLRSDFADPNQKAGKVDAPLLFNPEDLRLTEKGVSDRQLAINKIDREIRRRQVLSGREARRRSANEVRRLRRLGFVGDREVIEKKIREDLVEQTTRKLNERREALQGNLDANQRRIDIDKKIAEHQKKQVEQNEAQIKSMSAMEKYLEALATAVPQVAGIIDGVAGELAGQRRRLAAVRRS